MEELFGGEERKEEESLIERPPSMPEGTLLKGVKREFLEVDVAYQKRDFAPWFTLLSLLVYWVKFFVDLSGGDEVMGSLDDALEAVAPLADECRLQTTDWRRLFTYQFVHVDACVEINQCVGCTPSSSCLLYTSPSPRDRQKSRMPSSA